MGTNTMWGQPVKYTTNSDGHVTGVDSNGNSLAWNYPRRAKVAIAGASKSNRNNMRIGSTNSYNPPSFFHFANSMAEMPFDFVSFAAEGGRQVGEVEDMLDTEVLAYNPDVVWLGGDCLANYIFNQAGTNLQVATDAVTIYKRICAKLISRGITVFISNVPPSINVTAANDADTAKSQKAHITNRLIADYARSEPRLIYCPGDEYSIDMSNADGRPLTTLGTGVATTAWTVDGTHGHPRDAWKYAEIIVAAMGDRFKFSTLQWPKSNNDAYKSVLNPLNYGGTTVSPNCTLTGAGAIGSKVVRDDLNYNAEWQRIVTTAGTDSTVFTFTSAAVIPANMAVGVTPIYAAVEIMLNAVPTNLRGIKVTMAFAGSTSLQTNYNTSETGGFEVYADAGQYMIVGKKLIIYTAIKLLPATAASMNIAVEFTKSSVGNLTVDAFIGRGATFTAETVPPVFFAPVLDA